MDKTQATSARLSQLTMVTAIAVAFWPLWGWYFARTLDKSDEPWGLCALLTVVIFLSPLAGSARASTSEPLIERSKASWIAGISFLSIYIATFSFAPNLAQAVLAVFAIWFLLVKRFATPSKAGTLGLLLLSLPVIPSLNFFAGYPLRLLVARGVCLVLNCLGFRAGQDSTMITINNQLIAVDAPCSGINMLWAEAYVVMVCACLFKLNLKNTAVLSVASMALILAGNTIRAAALAISSQIDWNKLFHITADVDGIIHISIGLITFCTISAATMYGALKLGQTQCFLAEQSKVPEGECASISSPECVPAPPPAARGGLTLPPKSHAQSTDLALANSTSNEACARTIKTDQLYHSPSSRNERSEHGNGKDKFSGRYLADSNGDWSSSRWTSAITLLLCTSAAFVPLLTDQPKTNSSDFTASWPTEINGCKITPLISAKEEGAFAADFPGKMRRFTDGRNAYFVRIVNRETRQLHPSSDCFRGLGYSIEPKPLAVMKGGTRWSCFEATKSAERIRVLERIYDGHGNSWTDVSEWYWSACLGKTTGPWWDITIASPDATPTLQ